MTKTSQTEGEGGRHIPKRILTSQEVHCSLDLSESYFISSLQMGLIHKQKYYVFQTMHCFSTGFFSGQVKITLKESK